MDINELVKLGAKARLEALDAERAELWRVINKGKPKPVNATGKPDKRRKKMSVAARKALSIRMKAFWAAKKK